MAFWVDRGVPGGGKEKCMVFLRKKCTFQKIDIFHPKRHLGLFWCPFLSSGGACGSLLAPNWVPLAALGAPGLALGTPPGPAGTPPGASSEALGRCWRSFWVPEGVPRQLGTSFWGPSARFSWFFQFPHMGPLHDGCLGHWSFVLGTFKLANCAFKPSC